jgi:hypothetical protein
MPETPEQKARREIDINLVRLARREVLFVRGIGL